MVKSKDACISRTADISTCLTANLNVVDLSERPSNAILDVKTPSSFETSDNAIISNLTPPGSNAGSQPTTPERYLPSHPINPFYFRIQLSTVQKLLCAFMTVFVVPMRVFLVSFFLFLTWLGCFIGLLGYSEEELESKPMTGWRRKWWHPFLACVMRQMFVWGGLEWEFKGTPAPREHAPLLVVGPHSSILDGVVVLLVGGKGVVTKEWREKIRTMVFWAFRTFLIKVEIRGERAPATQAPILVAGPHSSFYDFGIVIAKSPVPSAVIRDETDTVIISTILRFIQPVFVKRNSKESRLSTLTEIKNRATSSEPWSQIVIFPEGTCSNGTVLIKFKQGAFSAGVPVQPILIRYPNKVNTLTWTWDGPSALKTLWLTTCQWKTKMIIEFLPVYRPTEAEKADPILYANNVRKLMASALGVPTSEFSYDDLKFIDTGDKRQPHHTLAMVKLLKFRAKVGLQPEQLPEDIAKAESIVEKLVSSNKDLRVDQDTFQNLINVAPCEIVKELIEVLALGDEEPDNKMDMRMYLAALCLLNCDGDSAFKALLSDERNCSVRPNMGGSREEQLELTLTAFCRLCWLCMQINNQQASSLFHSLNTLPTPASATESSPAFQKIILERLREFLRKHTDEMKGSIYFEGKEQVSLEAENEPGVQKEDDALTIASSESSRGRSPLTEATALTKGSGSTKRQKAD